MRKEDFFEVLGELDDDIVKGAAMKRKRDRRVWGAIAACLCLVVGAAALLQRDEGISDPVSGGGTVIGDSVAYSVAVYPVTEREENVDSAEVFALSEGEALDEPLAEHLPKRLPDGFHYGRGSLYHTVMKDGAQYDMLRIEYITGEIPEQKFAEDGGAIAPDPEAFGDTFTICVMNYEPKTDISIYSSAEEITVSLLKETGAAYIHSKDRYIGVFTETAEPASVLEAVKSIELLCA